MGQMTITTTADCSLLKELFPTLSDIIDWHLRGTAYGIGVDPTDGLLHAGAQGAQLTWMDAKVGDWVVTPRRGKPVLGTICEVAEPEPPYAPAGCFAQAWSVAELLRAWLTASG
jgi:predicted glycogen debranching enzyme